MTFAKLLFCFFAAFATFIILGCMAVLAWFIIMKFMEILEDLFL